MASPDKKAFLLRIDPALWAELERLARQFCHGSCSIKGNDTVMAGSTVNFSGVNKNGNGKFFVLGTRHIVSNRSGYTTEIMFCSNTLGT